MKTKNYNLVRYDADENKVFDWKNLDAHKTITPEGETEINHLYVKTLFIGENDSIDNYIEVEKENEE